MILVYGADFDLDCIPEFNSIICDLWAEAGGRRSIICLN